MKLILLTVFVLLAVYANAEKKIVCYHGTWSTYRHSNGKFGVPNIDPQLCTHLVYAFFGIQESGDIRIIDPYLDLEENWGRGNIKQFNALKQQNNKLKTLAAFGGWNEGSTKFSEVAKSPEKRRRFITTSTEFILKHGFDGLDLDWEYPAQRNGDTQVDKQNYGIFLKELKEELQKHNLLLTAAVASVENSAKLSYDIPEIVKYLDFINVMAYDLHGAWDDKTGINAPLYPGSNDITDYEKQLNAKTSILYWLNQGAPANKIILGVPFYGRTFTLKDPAINGIGAAHTGAGNPGKYTNEPGMIGYNELCEDFKNAEWTRKWEDEQHVPYAYKGNQWIGYEDLESLEDKANFVKEFDLGGIMVWSVETDDFLGLCGNGKNPLLQKINNVLNSDVVVTSSTEDVTKTTQPTTTTQKETTQQTQPTLPPNEFVCQGPTLNGTFRDPKQCNIFYICVNGVKNTFKCPEGLLFDLRILTCNYPNLVDCSSS